MFKKTFKNIFKRRTEVISTFDMTVTIGRMCPKCKQDGIFLISDHPDAYHLSYYLCENCYKKSTVSEFDNFNNMMLRKEKLEKIKELAK